MNIFWNFCLRCVLYCKRLLFRSKVFLRHFSISKRFLDPGIFADFFWKMFVVCCNQTKTVDWDVYQNCVAYCQVISSTTFWSIENIVTLLCSPSFDAWLNFFFHSMFIVTTTKKSVVISLSELFEILVNTPVYRVNSSYAKRSLNSKLVIVKKRKLHDAAQMNVS